MVVLVDNDDVAKIDVAVVVIVEEVVIDEVVIIVEVVTLDELVVCEIGGEVTGVLGKVSPGNGEKREVSIDIKSKGAIILVGLSHDVLGDKVSIGGGGAGVFNVGLNSRNPIGSDILISNE